MTEAKTNRVLMSSVEAAKIKQMVREAKEKRSRSGLPAHLILLAGFTEGFCRKYSVSQVRQRDLEGVYNQICIKWKSRGERADDYYWGFKLTLEKLLEKEGHSLDLCEDFEEEKPGGKSESSDFHR